MPPRRIILMVSLVVLIALISVGTTLYQNQIAQHLKGTTVTYPLTVVDDLGRNVTIPKTPERLVSLIPSATQTIFAVGAGDKVVGVTRYDDYPPELVKAVKNGTVQVVGGGLDPDVEKIVLLKPDIILIDGPSHVSSKPLIKLQELGFTLLAVNANSIEGILKDIRLVGKIFGTVEKGEQVASGIEANVAFVSDRTKNERKVRVYIENWHDPLFTAGKDSLQNEMLELAGGENIFSDLKGSTQITPEAVIERNPDVILNFNIFTTPEQIKARPGWDKINAVRNNKVFQMDPQEASPNPRVGQSLMKVAKLIHPEIFSSVSAPSLLQQRLLLRVARGKSNEGVVPVRQLMKTLR